MLDGIIRTYVFDTILKTEWDDMGCVDGRAFSLIALMVVIAIVAVLAAVAMPAYSIYIIKTRVLQASSVIQDIRQRALIFASENDYLPNARELNLPEPQGGGGIVAVEPSYVSPYLTDLFAQIWQSSEGNCAQENIYMIREVLYSKPIHIK